MLMVKFSLLLGHFQSILHKREGDKETIIQVYDRCCHYHDILAVTIPQVDEGDIHYINAGSNVRCKDNCLELIVGSYRNLKKGQDQYTGRIALKSNHLL